MRQLFDDAIEWGIAHGWLGIPVLAGLLVVVILTACTAGPQRSASGFVVRLSKGQTVDGIRADAAQCRNQARVVAGSNQYAWYSDAYNDCMLGRGYEKDVGQQ